VVLGVAMGEDRIQKNGKWKPLEGRAGRGSARRWARRGGRRARRSGPPAWGGEEADARGEERGEGRER
jgi:hypothetical protein